MPVRYCGAVCGEAVFRRDGLYWELDCTCRPDNDGIFRVYALGDEGLQCGCGVLQPEGGCLCARRRIAASGFPVDRITDLVAARSPDEIWSPWEGDAFDLHVTGGMCRSGPESLLVAMPLQEDGSFDWLPIVCLCKPEKINGRWYLTIKLPSCEGASEAL